MRSGWLPLLAWGLAAIALGHVLYLLIGWINAPLLGIHSFRQTQTALSAYWILHGGPLLAYETPVLGSPWAIPFELPIYQAIAALVALAGVPLDAAGRLVSIAFLLVGFWPLRMLWRDLRFEPVGLPIACALLLAAPEYAFWSRTFMMESCALVLALLWLALFVRFLHGGRGWIAVAALVAGLLAGGAKATTLPPFALLAGFIALPQVWRWVRGGCARRELPRLTLAAALLLLPFVGALAWVAYSDAVKVANPFGQALTSGSLSAWNYGSWAQRVSADLAGTQGDRMLDIFGRAWPLGLLAIVYGALRRGGQRTVALALAAAYLTPVALFTNLHLVHNYYQYANAAFLVVAASLGIALLARHAPLRPVAGAALLLLFAAQFNQFYGRQVRWLTPDRAESYYNIALAARDRLPPDASLLVFGADNWSSEIPYYAQRKALVVPIFPSPARLMGDIMSPTHLAAILRDPQASLVGTRFGGVITCGDPATWAPPAGRALLDAFLVGRPTLAAYGTCRLLSAETSS
ncbi:MAG: hypothetical protein NVSMB18_36550 [Acetobacteraceae bacterium]